MVAYLKGSWANLCLVFRQPTTTTTNNNNFLPGKAIPLYDAFNIIFSFILSGIQWSGNIAFFIFVCLLSSTRPQQLYWFIINNAWKCVLFYMIHQTENILQNYCLSTGLIFGCLFLLLISGNFCWALWLVLHFSRLHHGRHYALCQHQLVLNFGCLLKVRRDKNLIIPVSLNVFGDNLVHTLGTNRGFTLSRRDLLLQNSMECKYKASRTAFFIFYF